MRQYDGVRRNYLSVPTTCGVCYMYMLPQESLDMYVPQLNYYRLWLSIIMFRAQANDHSKGLSLPEDVNDRLDTLWEAVNEVMLARDVETEKTRVQNVLIELRGVLEAYHTHDLPEPKQLVELLDNLLKVSRRLEDPGQSSSRHH